MANVPIHEWTLLEAARRVREKEISSRELTGAVLARIEALDPKVRAYVTVLPAAAAAQEAAAMCFAGVGTDTGGSIRQPASLCGVVGIKPTYGRVSRYGMIAFASSLDQGGPIARTVADAAALLGVIAGYDRRDSTCVDIPVPDYLAAVERPVKGLRVGLPKEYYEGEGLSPEVRAAVEKALK